MGYSKPSPQVLGTTGKTPVWARFRRSFSALIWVAEDRGYFAENGLDVIIKEYESGLAAVMDLISDKLDIATAGEFVVAQSFERQDLSILAAVDRWDNIRIVARRDRDLQRVSALKGKRIGVVRRTAAEFCLARSLTFESISFEDVTVIDLSPSQQVEAIKNGEIDAAVVWEPIVRQLEDALGTNAITLPGQSGQDLYWVLVCKNTDQAAPQSHSTLSKGVSKGRRIRDPNEADAKAIVARRLGLRDGVSGISLEEQPFKVTLPQALLLAMEDQAKWMMSAGLTKKSEIPNFLDLISLEALKNLKPEAVGIFH